MKQAIALKVLAKNKSFNHKSFGKIHQKGCIIYRIVILSLSKDLLNTLKVFRLLVQILPIVWTHLLRHYASLLKRTNRYCRRTSVNPKCREIKKTVA